MEKNPKIEKVKQIKEKKQISINIIYIFKIKYFIIILTKSIKVYLWN